jgi:predicted permease
MSPLIRARALGYDLRLTLRGLLRRPAFMFAAVLTLALGIGVNTAIFSVVNAVMLQPLPFGNPDRLVRIYESNPESGQTAWAVSDPNFRDWRSQTESWQALAAFDSGTVALSTDSGVSVLQELRVTPEFLPALGFRPALGRSFRLEEAQAGGETNVTIISDALWRSAFGADPDVIGATARINDTPHTIIGVLPAEFDWDDADDFDWTDAELLRPRVLSNQARGDRRLSVIGLLERDVTLEQGRSELLAVAEQLAEEYPADNAGWSVRLVGFDEWLVPREVRDSLVLLQGAVLLVLLVACINVANLFLARGAARRKETAIRLTVGASRARIVWHGLVESTLLALIGAAAGIGLASAIIVGNYRSAVGLW